MRPLRTLMSWSVLVMVVAPWMTHGESFGEVKLRCAGVHEFVNKASRASTHVGTVHARAVHTQRSRHTRNTVHGIESSSRTRHGCLCRYRRSVRPGTGPSRP